MIHFIGPYRINKELHTSKYLPECTPYLFNVIFSKCHNHHLFYQLLLNLENVLYYVLHYCLENLLVFIIFIDQNTTLPVWRPIICPSLSPIYKTVQNRFAVGNWLPQACLWCTIRYNHFILGDVWFVMYLNRFHLDCLLPCVSE